MNNSSKNVVYKNIPSDELELAEGAILRKAVATGGAATQRRYEYIDMDNPDNSPKDIHVNSEYENIPDDELARADNIALRRAAVGNIFDEN